jgi:hypothetical protein
MDPPDHCSSPKESRWLQLPLAGLAAPTSPSTSERAPERLVTPSCVWAGLSAPQRAGVRQTARRICLEILDEHDRHRTD